MSAKFHKENGTVFWSGKKLSISPILFPHTLNFLSPQNSPNSNFPSVFQNPQTKICCVTVVFVSPCFQKVPKRKTKVVIDYHFNRMFTDKRFASSSAPLDKRGKPNKGNTQGSLRHYYHLEEEEGEEEKRKKAALSEEDGTEEESDTSEMPQMDSDGELEEEEISESGSTTEEEDIDIDYEDGEPEIQEENIPMIEKETHRLAVVNMDWRHVKGEECTEEEIESTADLKNNQYADLKNIRLTNYTFNFDQMLNDKDDPVCVATRNDGKAVVTGLWIDHSFDIGMPVDATSKAEQLVSIKPDNKDVSKDI
ncbi:hypothetical protein J1N35_015114 [Gossypium stocksii]|uniref:Uncharacterized protein n=1 Tax=Gossypium stocksii TaxID=47602 RepID=A0A9D4A896_9ROSI|nr:hypothetical protein J1N35_015114 [Gossypium stocksii]